MSFFSRKKNQSPSDSAPANRLASQSQVSQQSQFSTKLKSKSQSHSQSPQQTQQPRLLSPWSAHTPASGKWPSPFPRCFSALSTTATTAGELFLFGGTAHGRICNDQYVISTRDFSTTLLQTSEDVPSPRYGHRAVLTSTILFIWGGRNFEQNQALDDSLYLLNLVSREWTRIEVNGPGPCGRYLHTMTLVGSKLFVFGGRTTKRRLNDIWALDLNCLESNPFWESYDPAPGNEKPLPRVGHVSVTTGDRIIIFGGGGQHNNYLNDTWSFNISTREWTELQCTGFIPSPRTENAAVLVDDVMYVFGGVAPDETKLNDLTAFNLSTQRWIAFRDIAPSPSGRSGHAMACDGTHVFVIGGELSPDAQADETKLIHVLDINHLFYPESDFDAVNPNERTTHPVQKSLASPLTREQPDQPSSSSEAHAPHDASPFFQKSTQEELDHLPSGKEIARLEDGRLIVLEQQPSEMLVSETERDWRIGQLIDELALKSALLEQAEANAAEEKKRAGLELRELQAKLDESLLSRDHALEQALQKSSCAAEANEQSQRELTEMRAELQASKSESAALRLRLADMENGGSKSKAEADTYRTQSATGLVNTDEDRVVHRLLERLQAMESEIATLRWNEKSFEMMECRNEG